jgi:hypothetical protein
MTLMLAAEGMGLASAIVVTIWLSSHWQLASKVAQARI